MIDIKYLEKLTNVNKVVSRSWTTIKGPSTRINGTLKKNIYSKFENEIKFGLHFEYSIFVMNKFKRKVNDNFLNIIKL